MTAIIKDMLGFAGIYYRRILPNLPWRVYRFLEAYYPTLIFLGVAGFFLRLRSRTFEKRSDLFILSFLVAHLISIAAITSGSKRYAIYLVAIAIPWAAIGLYEIRKMLGAVKYKRRLNLFSALLILTIAIQLPWTLKPIRIEKLEQKAVGLWLKENIQRGSIFAAMNPQEAFYSGGEWVQIPNGIRSYQELMKLVKERKANYLIVDSSLRKEVPNLMEFIDEGELKEIYRFVKKGETKTVVFEIIY